MIEILNLQNQKDKVHLLPCAVNPKEFAQVEEGEKQGEKMCITHAGRITPKKGVPDL